MDPKMVWRLHEAVLVVCPIHGVGSGDDLAAVPTISYTEEATPEQKTASEEVVATFDYSQEAQDAWDNTKLREAANATATSKVPSDMYFRSLDKILHEQISFMVDKINAANILPDKIPNPSWEETIKLAQKRVDMGLEDKPPVVDKPPIINKSSTVTKPGKKPGRRH